MKLKHLILPAYIVFLLAMAKLVWSPMDSELASYKRLAIDSGFLSNKFIVVAIFAAMLPFLLAVRNPIRSLGIFPFMLLAIAAGSLAWTYDPGSTIYGLLPLMGIFGYALAMNAFWGPERSLVMIWLVGSAIIVVSIVLAVIGDPHVLMGGRHEGAWRGLFSHKNGFGPFVVVHLLITVFARKYMRLPLIASAGIAAIDIAVLVLANSGTAMIGGAAALCAGMTLLPFRHGGVRVLWRLSAAFVLCVCVGILVLNVQLVFDLIGRDATLSNRTELWAQVYDLTFRHILGAGYGTGGGSQVSIELQKLTGRQDSVGVQSGYLYMALELGWISVAIFVAWLFTAIAGAAFLARTSSAQPLFVALATQHLVGSYSESFGCLYPSWSLTAVVAALVAVRVASGAPAQPLARERARRPSPAVG